MKKLMKNIVCAGLAAALAATGLAGCGNNLDGTKTAATVGEDKITLGTANLMLRINQAQMVSMYSMFGGSAAGIWDQKGDDGKTYGESAKDDVMEQIHNLVLLKQHAADYDVEITEEEKKSIEEAAGKFVEANSAETIAKLAVSQSDVEQLLTFYTYQNKMFDPMTADVDTNVEDAEAAQSKITYVSVSTAATTDAEGKSVELTDEEKQAKKEQAQQILDKLNAQEDVAAADLDALAKEVDESLSASIKSYGSDESSLDAALVEAASGLSDGQAAPEVVEGENAYYVVRMDHVLDETATETKKESIVKERKQEAYDKLLKEWGEKTEISVEKSVWNKVKVTDADAYTFKQPETENTDAPAASDSTDTGAEENSGSTENAENQEEQPTE